MPFLLLQGLHIRLRVISADGAELEFKVREDTQLRKVFQAVCSRQNIAEADCRFFWENGLVQRSQTPKLLGMTDGDVIDLSMAQAGD